MPETSRTYTTKTGRELTDADIEAVESRTALAFGVLLAGAAGDDAPEGVVRLAVPGAVQPVSDGLA